MRQSPASFDELVERHRTEILAYLMRLTRNVDDAEDICQDALFRAYGAYDRLEVNSNVRAWLYRIATNTALNFLRRRRGPADSSAALETQGLGSTPPTAVEQWERLRDVVRAVNALPPKQRAALIQRQFQGLTYAEIGASLQCSLESARANVYQAIHKLREQLADR